MGRIARSLPLAAVAITLLWSVVAVEAKSSSPRASTHSTHVSSHHASAHGSSRTARNPKSSAGTRFIRGTCKTAACKKKHPSGAYMIPIKPKKKG
ncbi:MAG TPA: hypothetical protein VJR47_17665 [Stellaceae bacterium]|nr:hypothetical protein [Stellaceae bacterium]